MQGDEVKCGIVCLTKSFVRPKNIGHVADKHRFNVASTRPSRARIFVCCMRMLETTFKRKKEIEAMNPDEQAYAKASDDEKNQWRMQMMDNLSKQNVIRITADNAKILDLPAILSSVLRCI